MQSTEYPDLQFVSPRSYTQGRPSGQPTLLVVHYTAGSEGPTSAENGASYDQRRTDGTSAHYYVDSNSVVQCVLTKDRSHTAFPEGNNRGIHYELCGTVQTREQWLDAASLPTIKLAAKQMARDAVKYKIPIRRLTPAEMRSGLRGICGHGDVTAAWGQGDHTDPGAGFPWDVLLQKILEYLGGEEMTWDEAASIMQGINSGGYADAPANKTAPDWFKSAVPYNLKALHQKVEAVAKLVTTMAAAQGVAQADLDDMQATLNSVQEDTNDIQDRVGTFNLTEAQLAFMASQVGVTPQQIQEAARQAIRAQLDDNPNT